MTQTPTSDQLLAEELEQLNLCYTEWKSRSKPTWKVYEQWFIDGLRKHCKEQAALPQSPHANILSTYALDYLTRLYKDDAPRRLEYYTSLVDSLVTLLTKNGLTETVCSNVEHMRLLTSVCLHRIYLATKHGADNSESSIPIPDTSHFNELFEAWTGTTVPSTVCSSMTDATLLLYGKAALAISAINMIEDNELAHYFWRIEQPLATRTRGPTTHAGSALPVPDDML